MYKNVHKGLAIVFLFVFVMGTLLTGCSEKEVSVKDEGEVKEEKATTKEESKEEKVKVRMAGISNEEGLKDLFDLIKNKLPNMELEYQFISNEQFDSVINTQLAAGQGPDIMEVGAQAKNLASAGYLLDLSSEDFISRYHESGLSPYVYDGKNYAIPNLSWFEGIWYNKDIFEQNNLSVPKSFDEWMEIHEVLKQNGIKPQIMGAKSWEPQMKQTIALVLNEFYSKTENKGFDEAFNNGEATMNGSWNDIVAKWGVMVEKGYITKEMLGVSYDQAQDEFAAGKAAMWESGPWAAPSLHEKNPDANFGMFPIPGFSKGTGWLIGGPGMAYAVNADTKAMEQALEIMNLMSTEEGQEAFYANSVGSSFLKGVEFDLGPEYADCKDAFAEGHVYCPWNNWFSAQAIIMEYGKGMQDFIAGNKTIEEVLKATDDKAAEVRQNRN